MTKIDRNPILITDLKVVGSTRLMRTGFMQANLGYGQNSVQLPIIMMMDRRTLKDFRGMTREKNQYYNSISGNHGDTRAAY